MWGIATRVVFTITATAAMVVAGGCYVVVDGSSDDGGASCTPGDLQCGGGQGTEIFGTGGYRGDPSVVVDAGGQAPPPDASPPRPPSPPATCPAVTVSRFKELMIVDPLVTNDARASDQASYRPWSFRQRIEALVPGAPDAAGALADAWLAQWTALTDVPVSTAPGAARIPVDPRPGAHSVLRCPWLRLSSENGCDTSCTSCRSRRVDLARSPFRLLAIVNRADLAAPLAASGGATSGGAAVTCGAGGGGGELRFVYGAADPGSLRVLPFTVIFEYGIALQPGETMRDWAAAWHELGTLSPGSNAFNERLDAVVTRGLARARLQRVRTNEVAFGAADGLPWEMREFVPALTDGGTTRLIEVATSGTPRLTLAQSPELGRWIDDNASSVLAGESGLPATMLAASAPIPTADFTWRTTAHDAATAAAFNRNTCNGCHGGRSDPADVPFQHVAPPASLYYGAASGSGSAARLSRFLHNPGYDDELGRRERQLATMLCTPCAEAGY